MINENSIIESKRLIPCVDEKDIKNSNNKKDGFVLIYTKPTNFIEMVECEDDNKNDIKYEVLDSEIKILVDVVKPITIYYEVSSNPIFDQLKEICKC